MRDVIIYTASNAWAWIATLFPNPVAFTALHSSFPESRAFKERILEMTVKHPDSTFAIIDGSYNKRVRSVATVNDWTERLGMRRNRGSCEQLSRLVDGLGLHAEVVMEERADAACTFKLRADDVVDVASENRALALAAQEVFHEYGLSLYVAACTSHHAGIGRGDRVFQWCPVTPAP